MNSDVLGHHTGAPEYRFTARIHRLGANPYVDAPPRVSAAFGRRGAVAVKGTLNGVPIRATLVAAGGGRHRLYVNGFMRTAAGVDVGETVRLALSPDGASRRGRVPVQALGQLGRGRRGRIDTERPLWTCPRCGHQFVSRNLWHSCARHDLNDHFKGKDPIVRALFNRFRGVMESCGPVTVYAQKTRIVFQVKVRFAACHPRTRWLDGGISLTRRARHPRLLRVEQPVPGWYAHVFRFRRLSDFDARFARLAREAYRMGQREHLRGGKNEKA